MNSVANDRLPIQLLQGHYPNLGVWCTGEAHSRLIDAAIDTYVDYYTRGIDSKLVATLTGTSRKILEASEATGEVLRERERKACHFSV